MVNLLVNYVVEYVGLLTYVVNNISNFGFGFFFLRMYACVYLPNKHHAGVTSLKSSIVAKHGMMICCLVIFLQGV